MNRYDRLAAALALSLVLVGGAARAQGAGAPTTPAAAAPAPEAMPVRERPPVPGARRMTMEQVVSLAASRNPDARTSEAEVEAAEAARAGARGAFGPKLQLDGAAQQWNSSFAIAFAPPGTPGPAPAITVRDAFTWSGSVSLIQPLTSLFAIYDQYKVKDLGVDVARVEREAEKRDVSFKAAEAYLRLLEATRLADVAQTSVDQLEAQKRQAQSLFDNGVIGKNDLLRADLALANARERVIQSEGQIVLARGRLAALVGLPPDVVIDPAPIGEGAMRARAGAQGAAALSPLDQPTIAAAEARAVARRPELRAISLRIDQAERGVSTARARLLPRANLVGNYTHVAGSAFQQKNAAYAGVTATWDAWDWGTNLSAIDRAKAEHKKAEIARDKLRDVIRLEARQAFVDAKSAREALVVARTALAQAEENYRIVSRRFAASSATSFDVVDAEALLTQARARIETAVYGYEVARLALQRATGGARPKIR